MSQFCGVDKIRKIMKQAKKIITGLLISYVIVLGINLSANYENYAAGSDWRYSVFFTLSVTTMGVLGGMLLLPYIFRNFRWSERPMFKMLLSLAIYGLYGAVLMIATIKLVWHGEVSTQDYITNTIYSVLFSMVIGLLMSGRQFLVNLKKTIEDNERMKQEMIQSQYETLKSQVNPHFLFNSLNTLTAIIPTQPDVAVRFVEQLSKVFRYSLQYSSEHTIDLATELKVVRSYLFLNEQRFDGKLRVEISISEPAMQRKIITQSLLMLVENAIKHNELSHENPLTLSIADEGNYLVVKNTLQRKTLLEPSTGVGLDNISKRYLLAAKLPVVIAEEGKWFVVRLPLLDL